jgi:hypothetical protein
VGVQADSFELAVSECSLPAGNDISSEAGDIVWMCCQAMSSGGCSKLRRISASCSDLLIV